MLREFSILDEVLLTLKLNGYHVEEGISDIADYIPHSKLFTARYYGIVNNEIVEQKVIIIRLIDNLNIFLKKGFDYYNKKVYILSNKKDLENFIESVAL